jgi:hypothetical protein
MKNKRKKRGWLPNKTPDIVGTPEQFLPVEVV